MKLTVDGKNFDSTLRYTGKGAAVGNLMAKHVMEYSMMMMFGSRMQQHYTKEQEEFISAANGEMKKELDFLEANKKGVPESFVQYWKAWYQYSVYDEMIRYTFMHKMMKERTSSVIMRKKDYAILDKVPVAFNDNYISCLLYTSLLSKNTATTTGYSMDKLQDRGSFFIDAGEEVYSGQIIGEHIKPGDLIVNATEPKKLTNMRASGTADANRIAPKVQMSLEECMEYIQQDECIEITPQSIRLRKIMLDENDRARFQKMLKAEA